MNRIRIACRQTTRALLLATLACLSLTAAAADRLLIVTEELPPLNMTQNGEVTGLSTDVVRAVLKEVGLQAPIQSMPWARAYDLALNSENVLIYSIARTPQRETLFKWVGVVAPTNWYLYARADRKIPLHSVEDAHEYQIATVTEDVGEQYLIDHGFVVGKNLQSINKDSLSYEKLKLGRVDLWISDEVSALYLVREAGDIPSKAIVRALPLPDLAPDGLGMAFSRKTPTALVERFRKGLETIKKNGTYDSLLKKWL